MMRICLDDATPCSRSMVNFKVLTLHPRGTHVTRKHEGERVLLSKGQVRFERVRFADVDSKDEEHLEFDRLNLTRSIHQHRKSRANGKQLRDGLSPKVTTLRTS